MIDTSKAPYHITSEVFLPTPGDVWGGTRFGQDACIKDDLPCYWRIVSDWDIMSVISLFFFFLNDDSSAFSPCSRVLVQLIFGTCSATRSIESMCHNPITSLRPPIAEHTVSKFSPARSQSRHGQSRLGERASFGRIITKSPLLNVPKRWGGCKHDMLSFPIRQANWILDLQHQDE